MSQDAFFQAVLVLSLAIALIVFPILFFIPAPYGRYTRPGWGPRLPSWLGWLLMESVSAMGMPLMYTLGEAPKTPAPLIFLLLWEVHYIQRAFLHPLRMRDRWKPMPVVVPVMGTLFNLINVWLNGSYLFDLSGSRYDSGWLASPQFILGTFLFTTGFIINRHADRVLRGLRGRDEHGYRIPHGGLYHYISCPNYFGEILEWIGWAIATWSLPGLIFALWTFANLAPRARAHHQWYRRNLENYPERRKALIPGLW